MSTPLLLLHPLGSDRRFWSPVIEYFTDRQVFSLDIVGHGTAPEIPVNAHIDAPTAHLVSELETLGAGPVDVVGVSLGGLLAQRLAVTHPHMVRRLVLADTVTRYPDSMRGMWGERAEIARTAGMTPLVGPTRALWFTEAFARESGPVVRQTEQGLREMSGETYARACELLRDVDLDADLSRITTPTLILCGEQDAPAFVTAAPHLSRSIPNARLEWLPGAHAAAAESPDEFARVVRVFLDDTPGPVQGDEQ